MAPTSHKYTLLQNVFEFNERLARRMDRFNPIGQFIVLYLANILIFLSVHGLRLIDSDYYQYLVHAMAVSGQYPQQDWLVRTGSHNPLWDWLFSLATNPTQIRIVIFFVYLVVIGFFTLLISTFTQSLSSASNRQKPSASLAFNIVACIIFTVLVDWLPTGWGAYQLLVPTGLPSLAPNPLALLSVIYLAQEKWWQAALTLSAVFFMHFAFAVLFSLALFFAIALSGKRILGKREAWIPMIFALAAFAVAALPHLHAQSGTDATGAPLDLNYITQILISVRLIHMNPFQEHWLVHIRSLSLIVAALLFTWRFLHGSLRSLALRVAFGATFVICAGTLALKVPALVSWTRPFVYRLFPVLIGFIALALTAKILSLWSQRIWRRTWFSLLVLIIVSCLHIGQFDLRWLPESPADQKLAAWLHEQTVVTDQIMIPPWLGFIRIGSQRSVFVDFKSCPTPPKDLLEWYRRLSAITGLEGVPLAHIKNPQKSIYDGYQKQSLLKLLHIARNEGVTQILIDAQSVAAKDFYTYVKNNEVSVKMTRELDLTASGGSSYLLISTF